MITTHLTKHIYFNSPIECDDNCGTCDGARCDDCRKQYEVYGVNERFYDEEEAKRVEESINSIIPDTIDDYIIDNYFFILDGDLYYTGHENPTPEYKYGRRVDVPCNKESSMYQSKLEEVIKRNERYNQCKCIDKDTADDGDCKKYGCNDYSCFRGMELGKRTDKKWYM